MKALLLDQFSDLGGAQQALLETLAGLRDRGWEAVVGLPGAGELFDRVRGLGAAVERIDCGPYASGRKTPADVARFVSDTPRLARQLRTLAEGVDVVYVNGPRILPAAAMAGLRAPVLFHSHSYLGPGAMRRIAGSALRRLGAFTIANCEFVASAWRGYAATLVIYNGAPANFVPAARDGRTAGCLGRISPEKGQLEFLEAARLAHVSIPDSRFAIYGSALFGEARAALYEREVRERAAGLPVEFRGWVRDPYEGLAALDLLLVPSQSVEATTRVILEAYAAGVPVVAFASGGIPEVVEHGRTGLLVQTAGEMAQAAIDLFRDPDRRMKMAAAARDCWARRFTLDRYQAELAAALETAARRGAPALRQSQAPARSQSG
jgi:glycosyltransferase involved in cell wall biosynthesis